MKMKRFVLLAFFIAIELVLMFTPLGYIPIGPIRATTLHIPVIICSLFLGYKEGMFLGLIFGLTSLIVNTFTPTPSSFVFSPFISIGGYKGGIYSLIIVFVPRILLGLFPYLFYKLFKFLNNNINLILSSLFSTILHTIMVLLGIYIWFKEPYSMIKNTSVDLLFDFLMGIVLSNGVIEALLASIIVVFVIKAVKPIIYGGKFNG